MPGICTSSTRHDAVATDGERRNASADANATVVNPMDVKRFSAAARTDSSSSTMAMQCSWATSVSFMI
jgi:hypothetical protein